MRPSPPGPRGGVSSALKAGVIQGERAPTGAPVFSAGTDITCGEATVMLDRLLNMADVPLEAAGLSVQGHWAGQAAANLAASGVLTPDQSTSAALSEPLTRAAAAELLDGALDVLAAGRRTAGCPGEAVPIPIKRARKQIYAASALCCLSPSPSDPPV